MNRLDHYHLLPGIPQHTAGEILAVNNDSRKYGLVLSGSEAQALLKARNQAILNYGRIELGLGVITKIIYTFCSSPYINQSDYAFILNELVDLFYYMKNETEDIIGDDDLIAVMKYLFDNPCHGSIELLKHRDLTLFAQRLRHQSQIEEYSPQKDLL